MTGRLDLRQILANSDNLYNLDHFFYNFYNLDHFFYNFYNLDNSDNFLSDLGKPGVRSLDPDVRPSVHDVFEIN